MSTPKDDRRSPLFTDGQLQATAGLKAWGRGVTYYLEDRVQWVQRENDMVIGRVVGTREYTVRLWNEEGFLVGSCDCPMGEAGTFCKHCVAIGLAYLESGLDEG